MQPDDPTSPLRKRRKLADPPDEATTPTESAKPIPSPPLIELSRAHSPMWEGSRDEQVQEKEKYAAVAAVRSPVQLTRIRDLGAGENVDTVGLEELLGDAMIEECWCFNFWFDLEFIMKHFHADVRDVAKVKIIHGFGRDDEKRIVLMEIAERFPNMEIIGAHVPNPFGTHHTKMLILFRRDNLAQVVIHTANMTPKDWTNMTQAVWRSPLLPLLPRLSTTPSLKERFYPIGSGERFKVDLLRYLDKYEKRLAGLTKQLAEYDFSAIRAAFIGSTPSRQNPSLAQPEKQTSFGWLGLQEIMSSIPVLRQEKAPHIVIQVSSIATLGTEPTWLTNFQSVLSRHGHVENESETSSAKESTFIVKRPSIDESLNATFNVIFPTLEEIRTSLDGYESGASIHTRIESAQNQKQLEYFKPLLCHWKHLSTTATSSSGSSQIDASSSINRALRGPAAPHIKTYIRFSDDEHKTIDWAMLTSANLSKQAWGDEVNKKGEVWIQSWEAGVVVWPALFAEDAVMVPVYGQDMPEHHNVDATGGLSEAGSSSKSKTVVGFRMPYDLPLSPYREDEVPWCSKIPCRDLDWKGCAWGGWKGWW